MKSTYLLHIFSHPLHKHLQENEFVSSLHENGMVWVGATRMYGDDEEEEEYGAWAWDDNQGRVNFTNWKEEEGQDEEDDEEIPGGGCLALYGEKGEWVERPCTHRLPYICQIRLSL